MNSLNWKTCFFLSLFLLTRLGLVASGKYDPPKKYWTKEHKKKKNRKNTNTHTTHAYLERIKLTEMWASVDRKLYGPLHILDPQKWRRATVQRCPGDRLCRVCPNTMSIRSLAMFSYKPFFLFNICCCCIVWCAQLAMHKRLKHCPMSYDAGDETRGWLIGHCVADGLNKHAWNG